MPIVTLSTPEPLKLNAVAKPTPASLAETGISARPPPISTNTPLEPEGVTSSPQPEKLIPPLLLLTSEPV